MPALHDITHWPEARANRFRARIDDDGIGRSVEAPAPRELAEHWAAPLLAASDTEWLRQGQTIMQRPAGSTTPPEPTTLEALRDVLRDVLSRLPDVPGATRPYKDLRFMLTVETSETCRSYLDELARATRSRLPQLRGPAKERAPRPAGKSGAERVAEHRRREHDQQVDSARWCLASWADEGEPGRVSAVTLYDTATEPLLGVLEEFESDVASYQQVQGMTTAEALAEWNDYAEEEGFPSRPRMPGRRVFRGVASEAFGPPRRSHGADHFVVTADALSALRDQQVGGS